MTEASNGRTQLLTASQVAKYLGVSVSAIQYHRLHGSLPALSVGTGKKTKYVFERHVVEQMRARGGIKKAHSSAQVDAAVALHTAQQSAQVLSELLRILGMDHGVLGDTKEEVMRDYVHLRKLTYNDELFISEAEELDWARKFTGVTEGYMRMAVLHLHIKRPWVVYSDFFTKMAAKYSTTSLLRIKLVNAGIAVRQAAYLASGGVPLEDREFTQTDRTFLQRVKEHLFILDRRGPVPSRPEGLGLDALLKG